MVALNPISIQKGFREDERERETEGKKDVHCNHFNAPFRFYSSLRIHGDRFDIECFWKRFPFQKFIAQSDLMANSIKWKMLLCHSMGKPDGQTYGTGTGTGTEQSTNIDINEMQRKTAVFVTSYESSWVPIYRWKLNQQTALNEHNVELNATDLLLCSCHWYPFPYWFALYDVRAVHVNDSQCSFTFRSLHGK